MACLINGRMVLVSLLFFTSSHASHSVQELDPAFAPSVIWWLRGKVASQGAAGVVALWPSQSSNNMIPGARQESIPLMPGWNVLGSALTSREMLVFSPGKWLSFDASRFVGKPFGLTVVGSCAGNADYFVGSNGTNAGPLLGYRTPTELVFQVPGSDALVAQVPAVDTTSLHIWSWTVASNGQRSIYLDGSRVAHDATPAEGSLVTVWESGRLGGDLDGQMGEVIAFDGVPECADRAGVEDYFATYYTLSIDATTVPCPVPPTGLPTLSPTSQPTTPLPTPAPTTSPPTTPTTSPTVAPTIPVQSPPPTPAPPSPECVLFRLAAPPVDWEISFFPRSPSSIEWGAFIFNNLPLSNISNGESNVYITLVDACWGHSGPPKPVIGTTFKVNEFSFFGDRIMYTRFKGDGSSGNSFITEAAKSRLTLWTSVPWTGGGGTGAILIPIDWGFGVKRAKCSCEGGQWTGQGKLLLSTPRPTTASTVALTLVPPSLVISDWSNPFAGNGTFSISPQIMPTVPMQIISSAPVQITATDIPVSFPIAAVIVSGGVLLLFLVCFFMIFCGVRMRKRSKQRKDSSGIELPISPPAATRQAISSPRSRSASTTGGHHRSRSASRSGVGGGPLNSSLSRSVHLNRSRSGSHSSHRGSRRLSASMLNSLHGQQKQQQSRLRKSQNYGYGSMPGVNATENVYNRSPQVGMYPPTREESLAAAPATDSGYTPFKLPSSATAIQQSFDYTPVDDTSYQSLELHAAVDHRDQSVRAQSQFIIPGSEVKHLKQLGSGAFGEVWKCDWNGVFVAVKAVKGVDAGARKQLELEAQRFQALPNHPNVVTFYGIVLDPLAIVIEFCPGGALDEALFGKKPRRFDEAGLVRIARGICLGVAHLHANGVVHRDLAARNILLGQGDLAKVTDFGMSRETASDKSGKSVRHTLTNIGPVKWMAPEQLSDRVVSQESDIYSLGVVLFELFARQKPWADLSSAAAAQRVLSGETLRVPLNAPLTVANAMEACFQFRAKLRPTARSLAQQLASVLTRESTTSSSTSGVPYGSIPGYSGYVFPPQKSLPTQLQPNLSGYVVPPKIRPVQGNEKGYGDVPTTNLDHPNDEYVSLPIPNKQ